MYIPAFIIRTISIATLMLIALCSCTPQEEQKSPGEYVALDTATSLEPLPSPLELSIDAGAEYIDSFVFLGESTTYHLKNRGVLSGGKSTTQVWAPKSGTLMLDLTTASCRIVYPETDEELDLSAAMARKRPRYMLLTFGLNGASAIISKGSEYFKECYSRLIYTLRSASPDTVIILQSCFPVAKSMDMSGYSISAKALNAYIDTINQWTKELAGSLSLGYLFTSETLKDSEGFLLEKYQAGDGYHLTKEAYVEILKYIRTHAHPSEVRK